MSLQWTAVAAFLYAEVVACLLLCIPFISPTRWNRIFKSRLVQLIMAYGNTYFIVLIFILTFLLIDAGREVRKYSVTEKVDLTNNPVAVEHIHMKLFRAQRNLYIAGFALLLWFLLRRLVTLLSQQATFVASNEAFKKQALSASDAAKKYMEENEQLRMTIKEKGIKTPEDAEASLANDELKKELAAVKKDLMDAREELSKQQKNNEAMKHQAENLSKEYDRLLAEHSKLQEQSDGVKNKKDE
ncbi:B-cell receptor-associated protein 31 [Erpetoichthys calabaricus]|uniref:Endoplasmic reticulum transmembrane protein n=1 Tax=Erpetoichthys calabaricus TaxID=27687 RepID=A0A8C4S8Z4_ERPCA|nr:B-cell receptor-associated protein 31 [Erpetoichthys calabaricus]